MSMPSRHCRHPRAFACIPCLAMYGTAKIMVESPMTSGGR
jgi:hypothetical protein